MSTPLLHKNKLYTAVISDMQPHGNGVAWVQKKPIIIPNAVTGDEVEFKLIKLTKTYGVGKLLRLIKVSENRIEPRCAILKQCGGCHLQHLDYSAQLIHKQNIVSKNIYEKSNLKNIEIHPVIGAEHAFEYRNKAQFAFQKDENGVIVMGLYFIMSHRVADISYCAIQNHHINNVIQAVRDWLKDNPQLRVYDEDLHSGDLRHIVIRVGASSHEVMVALVVGSKHHQVDLNSFLQSLEHIPEIKSVLLNINDSPGNTVLGEETKVLLGSDSISDQCGPIHYEFSLHSFTQSDPIMSAKLYQYVVEKIKEKSPKLVLDLYCGIGVLTLLIGKVVEHVVGVELVEDAVKNAKRNATKNGISNATFYVGDVKDVVQKKALTPDVVVLDPPRKGCDKDVLDWLIETKISTVIYVSCHSQTLARDLEHLSERYHIESVQPFDNFAQTAHIECVAVLQLKKA